MVTMPDWLKDLLPFYIFMALFAVGVVVFAWFEGML
jgi:hypothetical protein